MLETLTDISGSEPIGRTDVDEPSSKKLKAGEVHSLFACFSNMQWTSDLMNEFTSNEISMVMKKRKNHTVSSCCLISDLTKYSIIPEDYSM